MIEQEDKTYLGNELKYIVDISASGFSMARDRFTIDIMRGPHVLHFKKDDMEIDEDGHFCVCFDTALLGPGRVSAVITAFVPDSDFADGMRTEKYKIENLINIYK